jgi:hypothetical protein
VSFEAQKVIKKDYVLSCLTKILKVNKLFKLNILSVIRSANDSNGTTQDPLRLISFIQAKRWEKTVLRPSVHRVTEPLIGNKEKGFL